MSVPLDELSATLTGPGRMFEMHELTCDGLPLRVWKNAPASLPVVLEQSRAHGAKVFTVYEGERTTFEEHYCRAATLAHRLIKRYGVCKGDRVAIAMRNLPEWPLAFWGAAAAGAVVVPLNAWGTAAELAYGVADSGATVVFADAERATRLHAELPHLPDVRHVVVVRGGALAPGQEHFSTVLGAVAADVTLPDVPLGPDDPATIFYTAGTTGHPKGALGTQRNICGNVVSLGFARVRGVLRSGGSFEDLIAQSQQQEVYLLSVPFFHVTGCHGVLLSMTAVGGRLVLMHKWDPERALELIERERVTSFGGVPTMVWQVVESPSLAQRDVSSVRNIAYGGAPAPSELLRRLRAVFPQAVASNGYGLTETSSLVSLNAGRDYMERPLSAGLALPICDLRVLDDRGRELPRGAAGELWIRGPNVVRGYWNKPEATAANFRDGWFRTGDIVRFDDDGFLYIIDRAKDMVIRGGENVYCAEVEDALFAHAAVLGVAVIGVPHAVLGEEVGAVVHLRPGRRATEQELREHVAARLAAFKVPSRIWFSDAPLPTNAAGKVLKRALRELILTQGGGSRNDQ
ncbi:MAG: AMP-dependent synthetase and ligase [Deltaproteobacteria bacterium]|nr:AMP-dependent synthetase and ligase [Deltaproteobacteria bacterium]